MKTRLDFVTNSSSSNFIIFGNSKDSILRILKDRNMFNDSTEWVIKRLEKEKEISGEELKSLFKGEIMEAMQEARERAINGLISDNPYDWVVYGDICNNGISKSAYLLSDFTLEKLVALTIELGDITEMQAWRACGIHEGESDEDMPLIIIGIDYH